MRKEYTYNDIGIFSRQISTIKSRFDENINLKKRVIFGNKYIDTGIFMSAPMFDVTGEKMQITLLELGQLPIIHRFMSADEQMETLYNVITKCNLNEKYIYSYSIGINDYKNKLEKLTIFLNGATEYNFNILICIDTANGATELLVPVIEEINKLKNNFKNYHSIEILSGNVVTKEGVEFLYKQGVKFIRCGISLGSVCSTSVVTGIYRPPVSMLQEIFNYKIQNNYNDLYIVADGGIKGTDDILKAIACGADFIMSGRLFAGYYESNSQIFINDNESQAILFNTVHEYYTNQTNNTLFNNGFNFKNFYKAYRGMASESMAQLNNKVNNLNKKILAEGVSELIPYKGDGNILEQDLDNILSSIRSSMSYANAYNLDQYRDNIEIIEISNESNKIRKPDVYNK